MLAIVPDSVEENICGPVAAHVHVLARSVHDIIGPAANVFVPFGEMGIVFGGRCRIHCAVDERRGAQRAESVFFPILHIAHIDAAVGIAVNDFTLKILRGLIFV